MTTAPTTFAFPPDPSGPTNPFADCRTLAADNAVSFAIDAAAAAAFAALDPRPRNRAERRKRR